MCQIINGFLSFNVNIQNVSAKYTYTEYELNSFEIVSLVLNEPLFGLSSISWCQSKDIRWKFIEIDHHFNSGWLDQNEITLVCILNEWEQVLRYINTRNFIGIHFIAAASIFTLYFDHSVKWCITLGAIMCRKMTVISQKTTIWRRNALNRCSEFQQFIHMIWKSYAAILFAWHDLNEIK